MVGLLEHLLVMGKIVYYMVIHVWVKLLLYYCLNLFELKTFLSAKNKLVVMDQDSGLYNNPKIVTLFTSLEMKCYLQKLIYLSKMVQSNKLIVLFLKELNHCFSLWILISNSDHMLSYMSCIFWMLCLEHIKQNHHSFNQLGRKIIV